MVLSIDQDLTPDELARAVHLHSASDTNTLQNGDIVESWDFAFRWDGDCRNAIELERWRFISDDLADAYIATLQPEDLTPKNDQLELLLASKTPEAKSLLDQLTSRLPDGVRASYDEQLAARDCFAKHAGPLLLGTFYVSLVGVSTWVECLHSTSTLNNRSSAGLLFTAYHQRPTQNILSRSSGRQEESRKW